MAESILWKFFAHICQFRTKAGVGETCLKNSLEPRLILFGGITEITEALMLKQHAHPFIELGAFQDQTFVSSGDNLKMEGNQPGIGFGNITVQFTIGIIQLVTQIIYGDIAI